MTIRHTGKWWFNYNTTCFRGSWQLIFWAVQKKINLVNNHLCHKRNDDNDWNRVLFDGKWLHFSVVSYNRFWWNKIHFCWLFQVGEKTMIIQNMRLQRRCSSRWGLRKFMIIVINLFIWNRMICKYDFLQNNCVVSYGAFSYLLMQSTI